MAVFRRFAFCILPGVMLTAGGAQAAREITFEQRVASAECVTDGWDDGLRYDIPAPRTFHSAVWAGNAMLVWGGEQGEDHRTLNTGARYDPLSDTWSEIPAFGAPLASEDLRHTSVWTGSAMIVISRGEGASYDPALDRWQPISGMGQPGLQNHRAVWTGEEMIVWGGNTFVCPPVGACQIDKTNAGGRYDPVHDAWTPTSLAGSPSPRYGHQAVWTGAGMMVWGGFDAAGPARNGGLYDPETDTWSSISDSGFPPGLDVTLMVATPEGVFAWGRGVGTPAAGALYDPASDTWSPISTPLPCAAGCQKPIGAWSGRYVIVWEGSSGGRYDPVTDVWSPVSAVDAPEGNGQAGVWTGSRLLVWGNGLQYGDHPRPGGSYNPVTDTWTRISTGRSRAAAPVGYSHSAVWTGSRMFVWGGYDGNRFYGTGGLYDPATDSWSLTSNANAPSARAGPTAIWTGDFVFVWGGYDRFGSHLDGGRYDPVSDKWALVQPPAWFDASSRAVSAGRMVLVEGTGGLHALYDPVSDVWKPVSQTGSPPYLDYASAVWTGEETILWSIEAGGPLNHRYRPATDTWSSVSEIGAPGLESGGSTWTGHEMVVLGLRRQADGTRVTDGARYDPDADHWTAMSQEGAPSPRVSNTLISTGQEVIVWGGRPYGGLESSFMSTGGRYDPASDSWIPTTTEGAPPPGAFTTVWADGVMLLYGHYAVTYGARYYPSLRRDDDNDGFTACEGDCDETNAIVSPAGLDLPGNPLDEDCDGTLVCDPAAGWKNRGQLTACIVRDCNEKANAGLIGRAECLAAAGVRPPKGQARRHPR